MSKWDRFQDPSDDMGEPDYCIFDHFICDEGSCTNCERNQDHEADVHGSFSSIREDEAEWVRRQGR